MDGKTDPVLCKNGCGFYGRPETNGLCSRCAGLTKPSSLAKGGGQEGGGVGDISQMSERELRAIIATAGMQSEDCFTVAELRSRAAAALPSKPLETTQLTMAGLTCFVKGPVGEKVDLVVLMMHGWSASANELFPIADSMSKNPHIRGLKVLYVIPQAPGYPTAWWEINIDMWMRAAMTGNIETLLRSVPRGLTEARTRGVQLLKEIQGLGIEEKIPMSRIIIGGFSQGAMTAVDLALHLPPEEPCGGVMALSGAPIVIHEWEERLKVLSKPPPVLITHGTMDPVLPILGAEMMNKILQRGKCEVTYRKHQGGHELGPSNIVTAIAEFWAKVVNNAVQEENAVASATQLQPDANPATIGSSSSCVVHLGTSSDASSGFSTYSSSSSSSSSSSLSSFASSSSSVSALDATSLSQERHEEKGVFAPNSGLSVIGPNGIIVTPLEPVEGEENANEDAEGENLDDEMLARALELSLQSMEPVPKQ